MCGICIVDTIVFVENWRDEMKEMVQFAEGWISIGGVTLYHVTPFLQIK
jgi:hypothetical protein